MVVEAGKSVFTRVCLLLKIRTLTQASVFALYNWPQRQIASLVTDSVCLSAFLSPLWTGTKGLVAFGHYVCLATLLTVGLSGMRSLSALWL